MMKVYDLKKYKKAVVLCDEILPIIQVLEKAEKFFRHKKRIKYKPVQDLLEQVTESKRTLKRQFTIQKKIVDNKADLFIESDEYEET